MAPSPQQGYAAAIEGPTAVARLMPRLRAHLPAPVVPGRELVRTLRQQGLRARPGRPLQIDDVSARRGWRGRRCLLSSLTGPGGGARTAAPARTTPAG